MAQHNDLGKHGEEMAAEYLRKQGYVIREMNWTYDKAEIDIIAQKDNVLAIVEVKTRSSLDFGLPQDFVKSKKIRLLVKAVDQYVISQGLDIEVRFDIIAIHDDKNDLAIEHLTDAFFYF